MTPSKYIIKPLANRKIHSFYYNVAEQDKTKVQKTMVRESLTRAFDELHSCKVHHDARKLFAE
jgi:hypothetical protein